MNDERAKSVAWSVLSKATQRVFAFILREIERDGTGEPISISARAFWEGGITASSTIAAGSRELHAVGLIERTTGKRGVILYAVSDRWREFTDKDEAAAIAAKARETQRRKPRTMQIGKRGKDAKQKVAKVAAEKLPVERAPPRPVSVWQIPWPSNPDAGL